MSSHSSDDEYVCHSCRDWNIQEELIRMPFDRNKFICTKCCSLDQQQQQQQEEEEDEDSPLSSLSLIDLILGDFGARPTTTTAVAVKWLRQANELWHELVHVTRNGDAVLSRRVELLRYQVDAWHRAETKRIQAHVKRSCLKHLVAVGSQSPTTHDGDMATLRRQIESTTDRRALHAIETILLPNLYLHAAATKGGQMVRFVPDVRADLTLCSLGHFTWSQRPHTNSSSKSKAYYNKKRSSSSSSSSSTCWRMISIHSMDDADERVILVAYVNTSTWLDNQSSGASLMSKLNPTYKFEVLELSTGRRHHRLTIDNKQVHACHTSDNHLAICYWLNNASAAEHSEQQTVCHIALFDQRLDLVATTATSNGWRHLGDSASHTVLDMFVAARQQRIYLFVEHHATLTCSLHTFDWRSFEPVASFTIDAIAPNSNRITHQQQRRQRQRLFVRDELAFVTTSGLFGSSLHVIHTTSGAYLKRHDVDMHFDWFYVEATRFVFQRDDGVDAAAGTFFTFDMEAGCLLYANRLERPAVGQSSRDSPLCCWNEASRRIVYLQFTP